MSPVKQLLILVILALVQCVQGDLLYWNRMYNSLKEHGGFLKLKKKLKFTPPPKSRTQPQEAERTATRQCVR